MIWFFLAGMIAGAVGMMIFASWWMDNRAAKITLTEEEFRRVINEYKEENRKLKEKSND